VRLLPVCYCCLSGNCLCLERLISPFGGFASKICKTLLISSLFLSILLPAFHILGNANCIFMKFDTENFTEVCRIVSHAVDIGSNPKHFIRRSSCFSATFSSVTRCKSICRCMCRTRHFIETIYLRRPHVCRETETKAIFTLRGLK
jgi:hypothetical protein